MENEKDTWKVMQKVKRHLAGKVDTAKGVRKAGGGVLIIEGKNQLQQKLIAETLKKDEELKVKTERQIRPRLRITLVTKGYEADLAVGELKEQNQELFREFTEEDLKGVKIIRRMPCRNPGKKIGFWKHRRRFSEKNASWKGDWMLGSV
ncbi:unnamed protein product [Acanthoscelides obtectus]|uniref:Uncharacterized protein n=1 Tax=Acanthoscelides obtectus TaxID=200917 RepID=A0A9P0MD21_ACAOB|nr:unnamed protein product [Acanthoscelides obtectus]CAK1682226.1 hypothetical protein AOBTE_LOCUS33498 [Acanthoscelides obtectus]